MGTSLVLFRIFDIDVRIHWSFALILVYGAVIYGDANSGPMLGALYGVLVILLLFLCVTLHEFGHALMARYYNIKVPHITLMPIGGLAALERMPDKPLEEFLIAIAGPAVNFLIAAILFPVTMLALSFENSNDGIGTTFSMLTGQLQEPGLVGMLLYLTGTNIILGIFNLLPAFPMDGGRILRALLAMVIPYVQATRIATFIGRGMAILLAVWGIFGGGVILLLIAFFVYVGGGSERDSVESRVVLREVKAGNALTPSAVNLYTSERISKVMDLVMHSYQTDYPVFDLSNNFVGVLTRARLIHALKQDGPDTRIVDAMIPANQVPRCSTETTLDTVRELMALRASRVVAIYDEQDFQGLITIDDLTEVFQVVGAAMEREGVDNDTPIKRAL